MEILSLPPWTLSASLERDVVAFTLGDGRRLAWRSQSPAECLDHAAQPLAAALLLGDELASRLAASEPRPLNVQYAAELDAIDWEALSLGSVCLAERFALARQLLSDAEPAAVTVAPRPNHWPSLSFTVLRCRHTFRRAASTGVTSA